MKKFAARAACNAQIRKKRNGCHRYLRVKIFTILYVPWQKEAEIWILNREKWGILVNISGPSPRPTLQFITNPAVNSENKSSIEVCSQTSFQFDSDISRWKTSSTGFYYRKLRKHTSPKSVFSMQHDLLTWDAWVYTSPFYMNLWLRRSAPKETAFIRCLVQQYNALPDICCPGKSRYNLPWCTVLAIFPWTDLGGLSSHRWHQ